MMATGEVEGVTFIGHFQTRPLKPVQATVRAQQFVHSRVLRYLLKDRRRFNRSFSHPSDPQTKGEKTSVREKNRQSSLTSSYFETPSKKKTKTGGKKRKNRDFDGKHEHLDKEIPREK